MDRYAKEADAKERQADADWFTERMASIVNELKIVKEPRRAEFLRGVLNAAMRQHSRCLGGTVQVSDEFEDR